MNLEESRVYQYATLKDAEILFNTLPRKQIDWILIISPREMCKGNVYWFFIVFWTLKRREIVVLTEDPHITQRISGIKRPI